MTGRAKAVDEKFCSSCGEVIKLAAEICPHCGVRQLPPPSNTSEFLLGPGKNRILAIVLAIFLGGLGVHKFYLGKPGQGILYILFIWTFLPAIISLIEALVYLFSSDEQFRRRYP